MSNKKSKKPKPTKKAIEFTRIGGLRDVAESLSESYFLGLSRANIEPEEALMDMDKLTARLEGMNPKLLMSLLSDEFGRGMLMGMIHYSAIEDNENEGDY